METARTTDLANSVRVGQYIAIKNWRRNRTTYLQVQEIVSDGKVDQWGRPSSVIIVIKGKQANRKFHNYRKAEAGR